MGFIKRSSSATVSQPVISAPTDVSHTSWNNVRRPLSAISCSNNSEDTIQYDDSSSASMKQSYRLSSAYSCNDIQKLQPLAPRSRQSSIVSLTPALETSSLKLQRAPSPKKQLWNKLDLASTTSQSTKRSFFSRHSKQRSLTIGSINVTNAPLLNPSKKLSKHSSVSLDQKTLAKSLSSADARPKHSLGSISSPVTSSFVHRRHISKESHLSCLDSDSSNITRNHSSASLYNIFSENTVQSGSNTCPASPSTFPLPVSYSDFTPSTRLPAGKQQNIPQSPTISITPCTPTSAKTMSRTFDHFRHSSLESNENDDFVDKENMGPVRKSFHDLDQTIHSDHTLSNLEQPPFPELQTSFGNYIYDDEDDNYLVEGIDDSLGQWISISNSDGLTFPSINTGSVSSGSLPGSTRHSTCNSISSNFSTSHQSNQQLLNPIRPRSISQVSQASVSLSLNGVPLSHLDKHPSSTSHPFNLKPEPDHPKQHNNEPIVSQNPNNNNLVQTSLSQSSSSTETTSFSVQIVSDGSAVSNSPVDDSFSDMDEHSSDKSCVLSEHNNEYSVSKPFFCKQVLPGKVQVIKSHGVVWIGEPENSKQTATAAALDALTNENRTFSEETSLAALESCRVGTLAPESPTSTCSSAASTNSASCSATLHCSKSSIKINSANNNSSIKPPSFNSCKNIADSAETNNEMVSTPQAAPNKDPLYLSPYGNSSCTSLSSIINLNDIYSTAKNTSFDMTSQQSSTPSFSSYYIWQDEASTIFMDDGGDDDYQTNGIYSFHPNHGFLHRTGLSHLSVPKTVLSPDPLISSESSILSVSLDSQSLNPISSLTLQHDLFGRVVDSNASHLHPSVLQPELKIDGSESFDSTEKKQFINQIRKSDHDVDSYDCDKTQDDLGTIFKNKNPYTPKLTTGTSHRDARVY